MAGLSVRILLHRITTYVLLLYVLAVAMFLTAKVKSEDDLRQHEREERETEVDGCAHPHHWQVAGKVFLFSCFPLAI